MFYLVLGAESRLDNEVSDLLVVLFSHTTAHVVYKLDAVGHGVLVLLFEASEADKTARHEFAVEGPFHITGLRQTQSVRQTVV